MRPRSIDIVVSTYRRPDALLATLESFREQRGPRFTVYVADDGSGPDTREAVEAFAAAAPFPVHHIWQPDEGFRLAAIRNRALAAGSGEYVIVLDGDVVVLPDFVERHVRLAEPGRFVRGSRISLDESLTRWALETGEPLHTWSRARWRRERASGRVSRTLPLYHLPLGPLRTWRGRNRDNAAGINLGFWRADLEAINGFDESFIGYGCEDHDCLDRLIRIGVLRKNGRLFAFPVFHLWHPQREENVDNTELLRRNEEEGRIRARVGLDRYVGETARDGPDVEPAG